MFAASKNRVSKPGGIILIGLSAFLTNSVANAEDTSFKRISKLFSSDPQVVESVAREAKKCTDASEFISIKYFLDEAEIGEGEFSINLLCTFRDKEMGTDEAGAELRFKRMNDGKFVLVDVVESG